MESAIVFCIITISISIVTKILLFDIIKDGIKIFYPLIPLEVINIIHKVLLTIILPDDIKCEIRNTRKV